MSSWSLNDLQDNRTPKILLPSVPCLSFADACRTCNESLVRYHLSRTTLIGEELNSRDDSGKSGLCHLCANGFVDLLSILISKAAHLVDPNIGDNEGNTPLILSAQAGHVEVVNALLHGFSSLNIDQPNHHGFSPLMKAAIQGRTRCAKLLLMAGASTARRDSGRRLCALEWAEYVGRRNTAKTIRQYMVDTGDDDLLSVPDLGIARCRSASNIETIGVPQRRSSLRVSERRESSPFRSRSSLRKVKGVGRKFSLSPQQELQIAQGLQDMVIVSTVIVPEHTPEVSDSAWSKRKASLAPQSIPVIEITQTSFDDNCFFEKRYSLKNRRNSGQRKKNKDHKMENGTSERKRQVIKEEIIVPDKTPKRKNSREERSKVIKVATVDVFRK